MNFKNSFVARSIQIAGLTLGLAAISIPACAQSPSPADWTQFHRDNMQRWNPYETTVGVGNVKGLQLKWKNSISGPMFTFIESSPAVVNGVVYFGSDDNRVYALDASTGALVWRYTTGYIVQSSPAVVNGVVYVGSGDGNMYALNASTGALVWKHASNGSTIESSPAVVNGIVYFGADDNNVYALNASTGAQLWSFTTGDYVQSSAAVANGVVYIGSNDGNLYALNATTGAKLWSVNIGVPVESSPAVANGLVYVGSDSVNMYALNASTGAQLWSAATGSIISSPAVANGVVFVGTEGGEVEALNASTGARLWSRAPSTNGIDVSPAVANGVVYIGSSDGNVYALNASTGDILRIYPTASFSSSPTIVNGVVYVRAGTSQGGGNIYALAVGSADLFLRVQPSSTTVHQSDLLTYAFPVWNLGPANADFEVLNTQVPAGTTFNYIRISGTPGLGTCTTPPYKGTGQIVCHENGSMAPNTTWTVRLTVKVTAPAGTVITENAATMADTPDPNLANNTATVSVTVQ